MFCKLSYIFSLPCYSVSIYIRIIEVFCIALDLTCENQWCTFSRVKSIFHQSIPKVRHTSKTNWHLRNSSYNQKLEWHSLKVRNRNGILICLPPPPIDPVYRDFTSFLFCFTVAKGWSVNLSLTLLSNWSSWNAIRTNFTLSKQDEICGNLLYYAIL